MARDATSSARRDAMIAERSPATRSRIALVDSDLDPASRGGRYAQPEPRTCTIAIFRRASPSACLAAISHSTPAPRYAR